MRKKHDVSFPLALLRPDIPQQSAFTVAEIPCQAKLDQNECPFEIPEKIKETLVAALQGIPWNRYPQPQAYSEIKERFAACLGYDPNNIVITVGCDQVILGAYWAAGGPGRMARIFEPTYPIFAAYGRTTQTAVEQVVLGADFDLQPQRLGGPVDVLFLVSPNNPTGTGPGREVILAALNRPCLVFVDEAYADYAGQSVDDLIGDYPNLLIGRSLSKATLAGVRLGYGIGHPELIATLERLLFAPYHLNALQLVIAQHFDLILPHLAHWVNAVVAERERVAAELRLLGLKVWPSRANFLLFAVEDAPGTYANLLQHGVRLRNVSSMPGLDRHLRVTIGDKKENDMFLGALGRSL